MQILALTNIDFPHSPINLLFTSTYIRPDSSESRSAVYICIGGEEGGGGGIFTTTSPRTYSSAVVPVLSSDTNVAAYSDTASCAAPVGLSVLVLTFAVPSVPVPVSSIGSLLAAPIKLYLPLRVKGDPSNTDVVEYGFPTVSPQGCVLVHARPNTISLGVVAQADTPTIRRQGAAEVLRTFCCCRFPQFLHDPQLRIYSDIINCVSSTFPTTQYGSAPMSI